MRVKSVLKVKAAGDIDEKAKAEVKTKSKKSAQAVIDEAFAPKSDDTSSANKEKVD